MFSSVLSSKEQPIRILYGSQGGTAQIFAQQLAEELEESYPDLEVDIEGLHEAAPNEMLAPGKALHIFLVSVTGVGEPPDNGRDFYEWVMGHEASSQKNLEYAIFGLGNQKAHPNHYNVIGLSLDKRLEELGASRVMDIGLGDDGECIEDDFDKWQENFLKVLNGVGAAVEEEEDSPAEATEEETLVAEPTTKTPKKEEDPRVSCPGIAKTEDGTRRVSTKYPTINLKPAVTDVVRGDLFHLQGTPDQFYSNQTGRLDVIDNRLLGANAGETGLHEIRISLRDNHANRLFTYETGDHLMVYPRNSQTIVEAYLGLLDVDPHAIIDVDQHTSYPFPKSITVYETLSHCVDLGAVPSPAFARRILGRNKNLEYKEEIAEPRRTVVDLLLEDRKRLSLEDLLFSMVPMKARYYSIASSSTNNPKELRLTFRPVRYMTTRGMLREGICTSYMSHKGVVSGGNFAQVAASLSPNPQFRLPANPDTPILMVAGGCGVAPIRAFASERIARKGSNYGPGLLYVGFRNPDDDVYQDLFKEALKCGALTEAKIAYSYGCTDPSQYCMNVPDLLKVDGKIVWDHLESGGITYLCGGARTFGAAVEHAMMDILQEHGKMNLDGAVLYLRKLIKEGRLLDDLAD